jgi:hypothetical protein
MTADAWVSAHGADLPFVRRDQIMTARKQRAPDVGARPRIIPNKHRKLQVAPTRRKLFGKAAKAEFLEWFAATCNISLSARKIGFHYRTVIRHWREDPVFAEQCVEALRIGYPRLEALALEGAIEALSPQGRSRRARLKGDREAPPERLAMTPAEALQLLREHKRTLAAAAPGSGIGRKQGRRPRVASSEEVHAEMGKALAAFEKRVRAMGYEIPDDPAADTASPEARKSGGKPAPDREPGTGSEGA